MTEKSNAKSEVQPRTVKRIAANAKHFQKHSKVNLLVLFLVYD